MKERVSACNVWYSSDRLRSIVSSIVAGVEDGAQAPSSPEWSAVLHDVDHAIRQQFPCLRTISGHVRRGGVCLQMVRAFPLLDHDERIVAVFRRRVWGIDDRTILNTA